MLLCAMKQSEMASSAGNFLFPVVAGKKGGFGGMTMMPVRRSNGERRTAPAS
jgi:hypothetical protein